MIDSTGCIAEDMVCKRSWWRTGIRNPRQCVRGSDTVEEQGAWTTFFTDSLSQLGSGQANYAAGMRGNFNALHLYCDLHRIGIKSFVFECVSPSHGPVLEPPTCAAIWWSQQAVRDKMISGWLGCEEDMALI